jgi:hypothetical protein
MLAVHAQQPMPFIGNGDSPPAVPAEVHVTAFLDRLLNVDDKAYEFQVWPQSIIYICILTCAKRIGRPASCKWAVSKRAPAKHLGA